MRSDLQEKYPAGLAAADPVEAIRRSLRVDGRSLAAGGRSFEAENVFVVAAGKAAGRQNRDGDGLYLLEHGMAQAPPVAPAEHGGYGTPLPIRARAVRPAGRLRRRHPEPQVVRHGRGRTAGECHVSVSLVWKLISQPTWLFTTEL
jgi:hypothetical protein